jgi:hypothetical protein
VPCDENVTKVGQWWVEIEDKKIYSTNDNTSKGFLCIINERSEQMEDKGACEME